MRGAEAENRALRYLQGRGQTLITRNWRCRAGELDLVMRDGDTVAIVEVRSRARDGFGTAAETVDARKQRRIVRATRLFLARRPDLAAQPLRFDVVAINGGGSVDWLPGAFEVEDD